MITEKIIKDSKGLEYVMVTLNEPGNKHVYVFDKDIWFGVKNLIETTLLKDDNIDEVNKFLFDKIFWNNKSEIDYENFVGISNTKIIKPVLLAGPPGSGKTSLAVVIGKYYGFDIFVENFNVGVTKGDITETIAPTEQGTLGIVKHSSFIKAFENAAQGNKTLLVLDEVSRSNPEIQAFLIELLNDTTIKGRTHYILKLNLEGQTLEIPREDLIIIATTNFEGKIEGIDPALLERFGMIFCIESNISEREKQLCMCKGMESVPAEILIRFATTLRNFYKSGMDITGYFSTRKIVDITDSYMNELYRRLNVLMKQGKSLDKAYNSINKVELLKEIISYYIDSVIFENYSPELRHKLINVDLEGAITSVLTEKKDELVSGFERTIDRSEIFEDKKKKPLTFKSK